MGNSGISKPLSQVTKPEDDLHVPILEQKEENLNVPKETQVEESKQNKEEKAKKEQLIKTDGGTGNWETNTK